MPEIAVDCLPTADCRDIAGFSAHITEKTEKREGGGG
jgi:hypothetical protein